MRHSRGDETQLFLVVPTDEGKLERSLQRLRSSLADDDDEFALRSAQALTGKARVEALLQRSWELRYREPKRMKDLAYQALQAAGDLPEEHDSACAFDLQARAWAELANSYTSNDEFAEAEAAMTRARSLLRRGSGDLRLLARAAVLEATLRTEQGRSAEADELLARIYQLYLKLGDRHMTGRTLITKGINRHYAGRSQQALRILQAGLKLIDPDRDAQLAGIGQQSLMSILVSCGQPRKAAELLLKSDLRQSFCSDPLVLLKIRWLEGGIQAGLGKDSRSITVLSGVRADFAAAGQKSTAASVGLDLLPILMREGKHGDMRNIARDSYGTFRDLGIRREAAKAEPYLA